MSEAKTSAASAPAVRLAEVSAGVVRQASANRQP